MAKDPAFLFYTKDWLEGTAEMELAEKGAYIDLLAMQQQKHNLPSDTERLAKLARCSVEDFRKVWNEVSKKFKPEENEPERIYNQRLREVVTERLTVGAANHVIGCWAAVIGHTKISNDIKAKVKNLFDYKDFLAFPREKTTERLTQWLTIAVTELTTKRSTDRSTLAFAFANTLNNTIKEELKSQVYLQADQTPTPLIPATPPAPSNEGHWESVEVNLGSGIPDKPMVKFYHDSSFDAEQLKIFLSQDNSVIAMNNDMHNMPKAKLEFALNYFCREVMSQKEGRAANMLRTSLLSLFQTRSFLWEKAYEKSLRTIEWLDKEINKYKNGYSDDVVQSFKDWYTQLDAQGEVYYKKIPTFDVKTRLDKWKKSDFKKVKKETGGTFNVPSNTSSIEELEKHYLQ